jgi:hypothetical protein
MRIKYYLLPWLLTSVAMAETMLERLCFASAQEAQHAIPILATVLIKGQDEISAEGACLNVKVEERRSDMFQRWVSLRLPHARWDFSTSNAPPRTCEIQVSKRQTKDQTSETIQGSPNSISLEARREEQTTAEVSTLNLLSGKSGMLMVENRQIDLTCTWRASGKYQIRITLKPLPPPVTLTPPPPTKNETGLSTELEVSAGQEVALGEIVEDLAGKEIALDLPVAGQAQQRKGTTMTSWWLKIRP